jgi:hypothetical protein
LAIIRPIPLVPPVTSATRPLTEKRELMFVEAIMETLEGRPVSAFGFSSCWAERKLDYSTPLL